VHSSTEREWTAGQTAALESAAAAIRALLGL
jgi:hypothetical protein